MDILMNFQTFCNRPCFFYASNLPLTYNFVCSFGIKKFIVQKHIFFGLKKCRSKLLNVYLINFRF